MTSEVAAGGATAPVLRVAMVCPYDLSRPGGVQGQAVGLAQALRRAGHEVLVVAPDDRPAGWATGHVYATGRAVGLRSNGSVAPVSVSPLAARRAVDAVREWRADVVHLHEPLAPVLGYGFLVADGWPTVATFHRSGVPRAAALMLPAARWACARLQVRVAVSDVARRTAAALCSCGLDGCEIAFNGVDLERFARATPVASTVPTVLFLGRHEHRKGLGDLLEAFSGLGTATPAAVLWVAGDGPETGALRARYPESDRIRWLGVVSDQEAADRLAGARVLCAPSLGGESFGMVLLEGMAARCTVVASDIPGYREAAAGHATLVGAGDVDALRGALAAALAAPPDPTALDRAAAHAAGWSMDRLAQRYLDVYGRAAAMHPQARRTGRSRGRPGGARPGHVARTPGTSVTGR